MKIEGGFWDSWEVYLQDGHGTRLAEQPSSGPDTAHIECDDNQEFWICVQRPPLHPPAPPLPLAPGSYGGKGVVKGIGMPSSANKTAKLGTSASAGGKSVVNKRTSKGPMKTISKTVSISHPRAMTSLSSGANTGAEVVFRIDGHHVRTLGYPATRMKRIKCRRTYEAMAGGVFGTSLKFVYRKGMESAPTVENQTPVLAEAMSERLAALGTITVVLRAGDVKLARASFPKARGRAGEADLEGIPQSSFVGGNTLARAKKHTKYLFTAHTAAPEHTVQFKYGVRERSVARPATPQPQLHVQLQEASPTPTLVEAVPVKGAGAKMEVDEYIPLRRPSVDTLKPLPPIPRTRSASPFPNIATTPNTSTDSINNSSEPKHNGRPKSKPSILRALSLPRSLLSFGNGTSSPTPATPPAVPTRMTRAKTEGKEGSS